MQILTIDVGTGTQDIYLFKSGLAIENGFRMIMPSPTMRVWDEIRRATARGEDILLTGVTMGGGPAQWAAERHLKAGFRVFATPDAARSFNDDLDWVAKRLGVEIIHPEEAPNMHAVLPLRLQDVDFGALRAAFAQFGVDLKPEVIAVAVFDHGAAPPKVSDRAFRFDLLAERLEAWPHPLALSFPASQIPAPFTRMKAVARTLRRLDVPLVLMDTAPAAVLGATFDPLVRAAAHKLIANLGNLHTLAFRFGPQGVEGLFEHHTGLLDLQRLEELLLSLAQGTLTREAVFHEHGHGALVLDAQPMPLSEAPFDVAVVGPRRGLTDRSTLRVHKAVPFGDMMLSGCFGLLAAVAHHNPQASPEIEAALSGAAPGAAPWDVGD